MDIPIVVACVIFLVTFVLLFKTFFGKEEDFWECVGYCFKPDIFSLFQGKLVSDWGKSFKLNLFLCLCFGLGYLTYVVVGMLQGNN